ncbi:MAG: hypothetical protein VX367_08235, partial [SAR324 cluster bacterium]|nr:hypothetical protein [SAR324 cluster bacterium]
PAAPPGPMTYAFTHMGSFLLLLLLRPYPPSPSLQAHISAWRLGYGPPGWDLGLEAGGGRVRT